jgi:tetratricopeptide (TPR) repeat protein
MIVGTIALLTFAGHLWRPGQARPARAPEDEAERLRDVREAFADRKPLVPENVARELQPLFEGLGAALRAGDAERISAYFDHERMVEEWTALAAMALPTPKARREAVDGVRAVLGAILARRAEFVQWSSSEVRSVRKLNDDEALVIGRHRHPNGGSLKQRWWVTRRSGVWKVYDLEDLDTGIRFSTSAASAMAGNVLASSAKGRAMQTLGDVLQDIAVQKDLDKAEKKLNEMARVDLPAPFEAVRLFGLGMILLGRGQAQEALDQFGKARRLRPDMPILDLSEGTAFNHLEKWDQARQRLEAYRDLLGDDAEVCRELGDSLRGSRRFADAAREYRKSLDLDPKDADAFLGLLRSLGGDARKDDIGERFAKVDNLRETFDTCADDCATREFPELLEPLVLTMRRIDPEYGPVDHYESLLKACTGHPREAVPLFKAALGKQQDAATREKYTEQFLKAMATSGKLTEAYAAVPDAQAAFRILAAHAREHSQLDELRQLLPVHAARHAGDPLVSLYRGELYLQEGRFALADKAFAAALAQPPDAQTLGSFRSSRLQARYHTAGALAAYREIDHGEESFAHLAALAVEDHNDAQLQALLDAYAKNDPESLALLSYRLRLKMRQDRMPEAIALFKAALAKPLPEDKRDSVVADFLAAAAETDQAVEGYRAAPDAKAAFQTLAGELMEEEKFEELRRLMDVHRATHPADPWLAYYQGELHIQDEAWDKAADVLRDGLKGAPNDVRDAIHERLVLALYRAGRWQQAYETVLPCARTFTVLADLLVADKKGTQLQALVQAHGPHVAVDPDVLFYQALAAVLRKQPAEAAGLIIKAQQKQAAEQQRQNYLRRFLTEMASQGFAVDAYRAAPDKAEAFETLALELLSQKKEKDLAALLAEYGQGRQGELLCEFYQGELHLLRGETPAAVRTFAAALHRALPPDAWRFRQGLLRARVKAGQAAVAYQDLGPGTTTFQSLAGLCIQEKDSQQLQSLIDAHRKAYPDDGLLPAWELDFRWLKQDYEGALNLLIEHRRDVFALPRFRWKFQDFLIRCLVKLKRGKDAVREMEGLAKTKPGNSVLLVLAHASTGDVQQTIAVMRKLGPHASLVQSCYQDLDLGPILRSEPFRAFREKFPEPKARPEVEEEKP